MLYSYIKTAWRNIKSNKVYSFINITGLAVGMAVAVIIGLWVWDELSFNKDFDHYKRIAVVMQNQTFNGEITSQTAVPFLMADELRKKYGSDFKYVTMSSWTFRHLISSGEKKIYSSGNFFEPQITEMLSLKMREGTRDALQDRHSAIVSVSTAKALFGKDDAINQHIRIDNKFDVIITGVYEDIAYNSDFRDLTFIAPWQLYIDDNNWPEKTSNPWRSNAFQTFVQLADHASMHLVSDKIKDVKLHSVSKEDAAFKPVVFLHPMKDWHLYTSFKNGVITGGRIEYVWLFGIIGLFVLLLACINFMNLSTARSEKRAKEVGIRKAIGSLRIQLVRQFYAESILVAVFAFLLSLLFVQLVLPYFNAVSGKKMAVLWLNPFFWLISIVFILITGLIAGSYPALYLSSFQPVKVLKGTFRAGKLAALPRKFLVVLQFTVSVMLIIGTIVVFRQIQFARNRPVGYNRNGLIVAVMASPDIHNHFDIVRTELKNTNAITEMAESSGPTTYVGEVDNGFEWNGKAPVVQGNFGAVFVSHDFGKTIGWKILEGRDFSRDFETDSSAIILNETAVRFMGLKHPVGETIKWDGKAFHVIGIMKDMVMQSPYDPVFRTVFVLNTGAQDIINMRINPNMSIHDAIAKIEPVFRRYSPSQPFDFEFTDDLYARKFGDEERIGKIAGIFAILAIFISCLGLFGMASFMAEQRTKEIGVRKVLGASVKDLWVMLSKDFVLLVTISLCISSPVSYYFMENWLKKYEYHSEISAWIFGCAALAALLITFLTVSYHSVKAAIANPVKSLRSE